jgi:hypothetical protein
MILNLAASVCADILCCTNKYRLKLFQAFYSDAAKWRKYEERSRECRRFLREGRQAIRGWYWVDASTNTSKGPFETKAQAIENAVLCVSTADEPLPASPSPI